MMRDARLLPWVLTDPARSRVLRPDQWDALLCLAEQEGLADVLAARLDTETALERLSGPRHRPGEGPAEDEDLPEHVMRHADRLFGHSDLEGGLLALWQMDQMVRRGVQNATFWAELLDLSRANGVTAHVSRALRLSHHLYETPVDPFLAWQGQRSDVLYLGRLLARDGMGQERAGWLRLAFRLRLRWRRWRGVSKGLNPPKA